MSLTKDSILAVTDRKIVEVQVPEWGGSVFVRSMSGAERDAFEFDQLANPKIHIRSRLVAFTACDETGQLLFTLQDMEQIGKKSCKPLDRLFEEAVRLNKISKEDIEDLKND